MEVTVVLMRRQGVKLSKAELEAAPRTHGFMKIDYWILENHEGRRRIKELHLLSSEGARCSPMLTLTEPDQTQLNGMDMVYVGTERIGDDEYPQAWWVRCDPTPPTSDVRPYDYAHAGKRATA